MPRIAGLGVPELLIVLVIVLVIFGVGRVGKIGGELGNAIRQFREGLQGPKSESKPEDTPTTTKTE